MSADQLGACVIDFAFHDEPEDAFVIHVAGDVAHAGCALTPGLFGEQTHVRLELDGVFEPVADLLVRIVGISREKGDGAKEEAARVADNDHVVALVADVDAGTAGRQGEQGEESKSLFHFMVPESVISL